MRLVRKVNFAAGHGYSVHTINQSTLICGSNRTGINIDFADLDNTVLTINAGTIERAAFKTFVKIYGSAGSANAVDTGVVFLPVKIKTFVLTVIGYGITDGQFQTAVGNRRYVASQSI